MTETHGVPPMSQEDWNDFVANMAAGHVLTSNEVPPDMWNKVFMPLMMGGLSDWTVDELGQIGCLWERYDKAMPRSVNGYPMFASMHLISHDDWERAVPEINRRRAVLRGDDPGEPS